VDHPAPPFLVTKVPGIRLIRIPAGTFWMGSPELDDYDASEDEYPRHEVRISRPFYLGICEVTQGQYREVMGTEPSHYRGHPNNPVENVSWFDAVRFCNRLSQLEGLKPFCSIQGKEVKILGGTGYRLPTEAEWEYACRAATTSRYCFGDRPTDEIDKYARYNPSVRLDHNTLLTSGVGQRLANAWGLKDMHGNVTEWCWDWYGETSYQRRVSRDPTGPEDGFFRVFRGGSFNSRPRDVRSAHRGAETPTKRSMDLGFRIARDSS
jgi:formylglycine-generating enzyme required for sulfatase activity